MPTEYRVTYLKHIDKPFRKGGDVMRSDDPLWQHFGGAETAAQERAAEYVEDGQLDVQIERREVGAWKPVEAAVSEGKQS